MDAETRSFPLCALLLAVASMMLSGLAFAKVRPEFVYPADGQTLDSNGSYMFWVKPIAKAEGYSWRILQNGVVLSERITGNEFGIHPGTPEHRKFVPGRIEVQARALLAGKWTEPAIITISTVPRQPVVASQAPPSAPGWLLFLFVLLPFPLLIYVTVKQPPRLKARDWFSSLTIPGIPTFFFLPFTAPLYQRAGDWLYLFCLMWPALTYVMLKHCRRSAAEHTKRLGEAYKSALTRALSSLPQGVRDILKLPAERLCLAILSYEGAFQNRHLSTQKIEEILQLFLYYWFFNRRQEIQIPNLLTRGEGGEATFPVPLKRLHIDVANSMQNVLYEIGQKLSWTDGTPFSRLVETLDHNWKRVNQEFPKKGTIYPNDLKDKISNEDLISRYLGGTPFVDFLDTEVAVSLPLEPRFSHMHIVGGTGHGKTQLLHYLIINDLPHVAAGNRSVIIIDSQGGLINDILSLASVGAIADRVVLIDPQVYAPALNLFDFGVERLSRYNKADQDMLVNRAVELYKYLFGALLGAELTQGQDVIFKALVRLMRVVPDATIDNLLDFLKYPELTRPHIKKMDARAQRFFETEFFDSQYNLRRGEISKRLWGVLLEGDLERMFAAKRNKLDMYAAMHRGSLILINTNKRRLGQEASAIFGRFFIALIGQVTHERELGDQSTLRDTFVYIDEAHEYFDARLGSLFEQARKFGVGVVIAHQNLGQFAQDLRETVNTNTAIKLAGGVSERDARALAGEMWCDPKFLLGLQKEERKQTEFACYIKNIAGLKRAIPLTVPFGAIGKEPKMTPGRRASLIAENRRRYGATDDKPPDNPKDDDSPLGDPELL
jgi:hypothetical protein